MEDGGWHIQHWMREVLWISRVVGNNIVLTGRDCCYLRSSRPSGSLQMSGADEERLPRIQSNCRYLHTGSAVTLAESMLMAFRS